MATIYKIYCRDIEIKECYVGSTENYDRRCGKHKSNCYNTKHKEYNYKLYKFIRANLGMDNFIIEQIIDCDLENRYNAELYYFKLFKATLNSQFPKRSYKEWYIDNREQQLKKVKKYYENNKQQIIEHKNQKHNCLCGGKYTQTHKATHLKTAKHQNYINSKL